MRCYCLNNRNRFQANSNKFNLHYFIIFECLSVHKYEIRRRFGLCFRLKINVYLFAIVSPILDVCVIGIDSSAAIPNLACEITMNWFKFNLNENTEFEIPFSIGSHMLFTLVGSSFNRLSLQYFYSLNWKMNATLVCRKCHNMTGPILNKILMQT